MSRATYVMRNGELVLKELAGPREGHGPTVISDTMPAMRHPITGKLMDSKSSFRAITRAHGCVEVGNETMRDTRRLEGMDSQTRKADISRAIQQLGG